MKFFKTTLAMTVAVILLAGCDNGKGETIYEEHKELSPNFEWKKSDIRTFEIAINDNTRPLEFALALRYASGYYYPTLPVRITEVDPDGNKVMTDLDIPIRDEKGEFIGEKGYDIIDTEHLISSKKVFPVHGKYTYTIEHMLPDEVADYVMEIGIVVRKQQEPKK
ncbi:MAG: hypothetical protein ACKVOR_09695 [Flavobacteriales bacterium]